SEVKGTERYGRVEAVPRGEAPREVVECALRAALLIGDGLYGVDLKETPRGAPTSTKTSCATSWSGWKRPRRRAAPAAAAAPSPRRRWRPSAARCGRG